MQRRNTAALVAVVAVILASPLFFVRCCCPPAVRHAPVVAPPPAAALNLEPPPNIASHGPTDALMQNVDFRIAEGLVLHIHELHGTMRDREGGALNFDDKRTFIMRMNDAQVGVDGDTLTTLMNDYVFAYPGAPLRNLHISIVNGVMTQEGVMHKVIDIPFSMTTEVGVTNDGRLRIHPTKIQICNLNGKGLMKALGITLQKMLDLKGAKGVKVEKNDLLIEPLAILPPPQIESRLVAATLAGNQLVQTFSTGERSSDLSPPAHEPNYMYFRGGTLRMGKLFMVQADMEVVDADPSDLFDFYLDRYNEQLSAGFDRNQANYGLVVFMRDFSDLGQPQRNGERLAPGGRN